MSMNPERKTQGPGVAPWVFLIDQIGPDTYAFRSHGEVSLVDRVTLKRLILRIIGGWHDQVGGDDVGRT